MRNEALEFWSLNKVVKERKGMGMKVYYCIVLYCNLTLLYENEKHIFFVG